MRVTCPKPDAPISYKMFMLRMTDERGSRIVTENTYGMSPSPRNRVDRIFLILINEEANEPLGSKQVD